jgi:hypothetical protein
VRFVEVVEVDDQVLLGWGVEAEISEVRVTADDRLGTGGWQTAEVFSHHDGGAAQEAVWGGGHPRCSDWDEPFHAALVGIHDLGDDVRAAGRRIPVAQR